ncbi:MAG TPA: SGNH/GDSL hydrolase family protein [Cyclobacteriaceae bacterium]|nr:SGNH/GDSL hydrolase family protein [Cyclobacteriaceae bacterium]
MKRFLLLPLVLIGFLSLTPKEIHWVAIGDSITYLNDHSDETGDRISKGYMTLISEKYPQVKYFNQGHNGWTAVNIADKITSLGIQKADVYTVFLGTNDWWQGKPLGTIADYRRNKGTATVYGAFRIIIDHLKELNKEAEIILITPMQRGDFVYINNYKNNAYGSYREKAGQSLEQFADAVLEIGEIENIPVVDLYHDEELTLENMVHFKRLKNPSTGAYQNYKYPEYIDIPFDPEHDDYPYPKEAIHLTYDGLHPSDKGYEIIAAKLKGAARRLISQSGRSK